jgi:hypothetical protein
MRQKSAAAMFQENGIVFHAMPLFIPSEA